MILGAGWIAALTAIRRELRNYRPQPTPAEFAKARLLEVVAMDRARSGDGRWVPSVPRVRLQMVDMGWSPGTVKGTRVWLKNAFRWEPRR